MKSYGLSDFQAIRIGYYFLGYPNRFPNNVNLPYSLIIVIIENIIARLS
jgi:hypothetical protein